MGSATTYYSTVALRGPKFESRLNYLFRSHPLSLSHFAWCDIKQSLICLIIIKAKVAKINLNKKKLTPNILMAIYIYIYICTLCMCVFDSIVESWLWSRKEIFVCRYLCLYQVVTVYTLSKIIKVKVKVSFIVNSATCTLHTYRELKLRYSQTLGAYS